MIIQQLTPSLTGNFCQCPNAIIRGSLSAIAKIILLVLLSHQSGYNLSQSQLLREVGCGREALLRGLREIEDAGYLSREQSRDHNRLGCGIWSVNAMPEIQQSEIQQSEIQQSDFQQSENPTAESIYKKTKKEEDQSGEKNLKNISFPNPERARDLYMPEEPEPEGEFFNEPEPEPEGIDELAERRNRRLTEKGITLNPLANQQRGLGESDNGQSSAAPAAAPKIDPDFVKWLGNQWVSQYGGTQQGNEAKVRSHLGKPGNLELAQRQYGDRFSQWINERMQFIYTKIYYKETPSQWEQAFYDRHSQHGWRAKWLELHGVPPNAPEPPAQFISQEEQNVLREKILAFAQS